MPLLRREDHPEEGWTHIEWSLRRPPAEVWQNVKDPTVLPRWMGRAVKFEPVLGGDILIDHGDDTVCRSEMLAVESGRSFTISWEFPGEPTSQLSVELLALDQQVPTAQIDPGANEPATVISIRHEGLGDLLHSYAAGWMAHLTYFEAAVEGTDMPWAQFWNLTATMERF